MGSPLAPLLANWFVARIEEKLLSDEQHKKYQPIIYKRYVDDIFATFKCLEDRNKFFIALNEAHPNLSFTMEEPASTLPFLDVSITIMDGAYHTSVYRKPTNTGVVMHYSSMAPSKWKRALVQCLVTRAHRVSSDFNSFTIELNNIKSLCSKNGYPSTFTESIIDEFIKSTNISEDNYKPAMYPTKRANQDNNIKTAYFTVPYYGKASLKIQKCVKTEMEQHGIKIISSYNTKTVGSYFNLKSSCSNLFKSNIVYQFVCSQDQRVSYIGETTRQFYKRVDEHTRTDQNSAVFEHLFNCAGCQNHPNVCELFKILISCNNNNIYSHEALLIKKFRPSLNIQLGPGK